MTAYRDDDKWIFQESQVDTDSKTITTRIRHFSQYAVIVPLPPSQTNFSETDLKTNPEEAEPREYIVEIGESAGTFVVAVLHYWRWQQGLYQQRRIFPQ